MKELAQTLINTDTETCFSDLLEILNGTSIDDLYDSLDDIELIKKMAIRFSGQREFLNYEDRLCELIGDDEYFEWADENEVK